MTPPVERPQPFGPIVDLLANGVGYAGVEGVLKTVRKYLSMDVAFIAHFGETDRVFEHVDADGPVPIAPGMRLPLEIGYCAKVVRGELPQLIPDTSVVPAALAIPETTALPIGCHLSVPIVLDNGAVYGTLCCFSRLPDRTLGDREMKMMQAFAEVLATSIGDTQRAQASRTQRADEIRELIAAGQPRMVYQPMYRLRTGEVAGVECLARFDVEPQQTPDRWFATAHKAGLGAELELAAIRNALRPLERFPERFFLSVNSSPAVIVSGGLEPALGGVNLGRILLEITEHSIVENYQDLESVLRPLRRQGLRVAIDDAGAGYASMRHIVNLHPDLIKLDISLVRNIDTDHSRRALARALTTFARDIGSIVSAEGVETAAELEVLRELGVDKAQGYFLSLPLPLEEAVHAAPLDVRRALHALPA
jgi:EAL domain-containing protein (putative c-di-GMP-specific phosphodiesterase class I)